MLHNYFGDGLTRSIFSNDGLINKMPRQTCRNLNCGKMFEYNETMGGLITCSHCGTGQRVRVGWKRSNIHPNLMTKSHPSEEK